MQQVAYRQFGAFGHTGGTAGVLDHEPVIPVGVTLLEIVAAVCQQVEVIQCGATRQLLSLTHLAAQVIVRTHLDDMAKTGGQINRRPGEYGTQRIIGNQHRKSGVPNLVDQFRGRQQWRDAGASTTEFGQCGQGDRIVGKIRHVQANDVVFFDTETCQGVGQPIGLQIEFQVTDFPVLVLQGHTIRPEPRMFLDMGAEWPVVEIRSGDAEFIVDLLPGRRIRSRVHIAFFLRVVGGSDHSSADHQRLPWRRAQTNSHPAQ